MQEYLKTYKKDVLLLRQQDFYLEHEKLENYNYDSPNSIDWKLMEAVISKIKAKCPVRLPKWDMQTEKRTLTEEQSYNDYIIIVDGTFIYSKQANLNIDFKIYLDTDEDIRLSRRSIATRLQAASAQPPFALRPGRPTDSGAPLPPLLSAHRKVAALSGRSSD